MCPTTESASSNARLWLWVDADFHYIMYKSGLSESFQLNSSYAVYIIYIR